MVLINLLQFKSSSLGDAVPYYDNEAYFEYKINLLLNIVMPQYRNRELHHCRVYFLVLLNLLRFKSTSLSDAVPYYDNESVAV